MAPILHKIRMYRRVGNSERLKQRNHGETFSLRRIGEAAIGSDDVAAARAMAAAWELWFKHAKKPIVARSPVLDGGAESFLDAARESGIALLGIA
jgi:hypothetical protein